jgi:hypothetical protein
VKDAPLVDKKVMAETVKRVGEEARDDVYWSPATLFLSAYARFFAPRTNALPGERSLDPSEAVVGADGNYWVARWIAPRPSQQQALDADLAGALTPRGRVHRWWVPMPVVGPLRAMFEVYALARRALQTVGHRQDSKRGRPGAFTNASVVEKRKHRPWHTLAEFANHLQCQLNGCFRRMYGKGGRNMSSTLFQQSPAFAPSMVDVITTPAGDSFRVYKQDPQIAATLDDHVLGKGADGGEWFVAEGVHVSNLQVDFPLRQTWQRVRMGRNLPPIRSGTHYTSGREKPLVQLARWNLVSLPGVEYLFCRNTNQEGIGGCMPASLVHCYRSWRPVEFDAEVEEFKGPGPQSSASVSSATLAALGIGGAGGGAGAAGAAGGAGGGGMSGGVGGVAPIRLGPRERQSRSEGLIRSWIADRITPETVQQYLNEEIVQRRRMGAFAHAAYSWSPETILSTNTDAKTGILNLEGATLSVRQVIRDGRTWLDGTHLKILFGDWYAPPGRAPEATPPPLYQGHPRVQGITVLLLSDAESSAPVRPDVYGRGAPTDSFWILINLGHGHWEAVFYRPQTEDGRWAGDQFTFPASRVPIPIWSLFYAADHPIARTPVPRVAGVAGPATPIMQPDEAGAAPPGPEGPGISPATLFPTPPWFGEWYGSPPEHPLLVGESKRDPLLPRDQKTLDAGNTEPEVECVLTDARIPMALWGKLDDLIALYPDHIVLRGGAWWYRGRASSVGARSTCLAAPISASGGGDHYDPEDAPLGWSVAGGMSVEGKEGKEGKEEKEKWTAGHRAEGKASKTKTKTGRPAYITVDEEDDALLELALRESAKESRIHHQPRPLPSSSSSSTSSSSASSTYSAGKEGGGGGGGGGWGGAGLYGQRILIHMRPKKTLRAKDLHQWANVNFKGRAGVYETDVIADSCPRIDAYLDILRRFKDVALVARIGPPTLRGAYSCHPTT